MTSLQRNKLHNPHKWKAAAAQALIHLTILVLLFCMAYPLFMSVWGAFKNPADYEASKFFPTLPLRISNLSAAFAKVGQYIYNTIAVAFFGVLGSLLISSLASYAFSKMDFPGRTLLFMLTISLMMIPGCLTLIPQFLLYRNLNLNNTLFSILLPQLTVSPVGQVFLLTMIFKALPDDLFNAARIDGASDFQIYRYIAIPVSLPILITQAIMQVNGLWNDYIWPMTIISTNHDKLTISAGLVLEFRSQYSQNMPVTYAGYLLASLPLLVVFLLGNKTYISGLMSSSIKM